MLVGASVRSAAQSAQNAGFCVTGVDLFGDTDTRSACHQYFPAPTWQTIQSVIDQCKGLPVIAVGGLSADQPIAQLLSDSSPNLGGQLPSDFKDGKTSQLCDVGYLQHLATAAGMQFPPTRRTTTDLASSQSLSAQRWLAKDDRSCGGLGVRRWSSGQRLLGDEVLQQWIPGRMHGATFLSNGTDVKLLAVCRSLFTRQVDRPFVYAGSFGPIEISPGLIEMLQRFGQLLVDSTGLRGLLNVDFVLDRNKSAWLIEINPRWSGSSELVERKLIDAGFADPLFRLMFDAWSNVSAGSELVLRRTDFATPMTQSDCSTYLKRIVFATSESRFDASTIQRLLTSEEKIHDIPADGTLIHPGQPVCTVITQVAYNEQDPMHRHRVLLRKIKLAIRLP